MNRYVGPLLSVVVGAFIMICGLSVDFGGDYSECDGQVLQEGDYCQEFGRGGGDSWGYEDIAEREADSSEYSRNLIMGVGGVVIIAAIFFAVRTSRKIADAAVAGDDWPAPHDPGDELAHAKPGDATLTVFANALRYVDRYDGERWVAWDHVDDMKYHLVRDKWGDFTMYITIHTGGRSLKITEVTKNPSIVDDIVSAVLRAKIPAIARSFEAGTGFCLDTRTNLYLTLTGFTQQRSGQSFDIGWHEIAAIERQPNSTVRILGGDDTWGTFPTKPIANLAAFNVALQLRRQAIGQ